MKRDWSRNFVSFVIKLIRVKSFAEKLFEITFLLLEKSHKYTNGFQYSSCNSVENYICFSVQNHIQFSGYTADARKQ